MGNCEGTTVKGNHEFTPTQIGDKVWSINYKHDNVEVEGNIAKCAEHDEPGLALLKVPAKEQEIMRFRVYFNPEAASLGIGIFDLDIVKHTDFSGQTTYGLGHGMWTVYSDKQLCSSNDSELDKKSKGFAIANQDIIACDRSGDQLKVTKESTAETVQFKLDADTKYYFGAYFCAGWNSEKGEPEAVGVEILQ